MGLLGRSPGPRRRPDPRERRAKINRSTLSVAFLVQFYTRFQSSHLRERKRVNETLFTMPRCGSGVHAHVVLFLISSGLAQGLGPDNHMRQAAGADSQMIQLQFDGTPPRVVNTSAAAAARSSASSGEPMVCTPMVWHEGKRCDTSIKFDPNNAISQTNRLLGYGASEHIATTRDECTAQCLEYLADPSASTVTPNQGPIADACCRWWPAQAGTHMNACCIYGGSTLITGSSFHAAITVCTETTPSPTASPTPSTTPSTAPRAPNPRAHLAPPRPRPSPPRRSTRAPGEAPRRAPRVTATCCWSSRRS